MSGRDPYRGRPKKNPLAPSSRKPTAREASWGNSWRRDSYSTRGIANVNYSRVAWLVTTVYFVTAGLLIAADVAWWKLLYWLVPLGVVVLWFWRFVIYEWIDLFRDAVHRDRKLRMLKQGKEYLPDTRYVPPEEELDKLLSADPRPHQHLGADWKTYREHRRRQRDS